MEDNYIDCKTIKGITHFLYSTQNYKKASNSEDIVLNHWRNGNEGEWVLTDDNCVVQILKKGYITDKKNNKIAYIRTICGTFSLDSNDIMEGKIAENIYTFARTNEYNRFVKKEGVSSREVLFAKYIAKGENAVSAYTRAYSTNNESYAKSRSTQLLKTKRIQQMISEEVKKVLDEEGVSPNYIISRYKQISDIGENDAVTLRALDSLAKISGLFNTEDKKQEQLTVWTGFTPEQIEAIKQEKLVAVGENEK
tara:strand:- start:306 stop:1061 length:756 start_codon:yes stop_codon:yes gene_type:complete